MNLIVDHAPEIFVNNIDRFVAEVEDADYLNLFITSLNDQDVTKTLYKTGYHHTSASTTSDSPSFFRYIIFIVFLLFLKILYYTLVALNHLKSISYVTNFDFRQKYITSILTTDAKKNPPDLESAMKRIKDLKGKNFHTDLILFYYCVCGSVY